MTDIRTEIKKIWLESFADAREYVDMYFDRVYRDEDALTLDISGQTVSSMLLQHYAMRIHGSILPTAYVAGAATRRQLRGRGYMSRLMERAITESYSRGDALCALIPASEWLYSYYRKFGFATVFFIDPQRYTALHTFTCADLLHEEEAHYSPGVIDAFIRLEQTIPCGITHSGRDYLNILDDLRLDQGRFVAMADDQHTIRSMAWATCSDDLLTVRCLLYDSPEARESALARLRHYYPSVPMLVMSAPGESAQSRRLAPRGMCRIVNVGMVLSAAAASNPTWECTLRVSDPLIADNNRTFTISGGQCTAITDDNPSRSTAPRPDLDVDVVTLTEIVFSTPAMGDIMGYPSQRPYMALMLD